MLNKFKKFMAIFSVLGFIALGVGCSDYDDDIDGLQTQIDELKTGSIASIESQLTSLSTTVGNLQSAQQTLQSGLSNLQSDLSSLQSDVNNLESVKSEVESLKTKIEEIESTFVSKDFLTTTLSSYATTESVAETAEELRKAVNDAKTELQAAIAAAQTAADKVAEEKVAELETKISELQAAIAAAQTAAVKSAGEACAAAFQGKFDAAVSAAKLVDNENLSNAIKDYDAKIKEYITSAINDNNGVIDGKISEQIKSAVGSLQKLIVGRLTSLKLIPDAYENGIETIELNALTYTEWKNVAAATARTETTPTQTGGNHITSAADKVKTVKYHVSPANVTTEGIGAVKFWLQTASDKDTRAAAVKAEDLFEITGFAVNTTTDGLKTLDVDLKKKLGANLSAGAGKIYTVALEATIADDLCVDGETGAKVYSDYAKLSENVITPEIAQLTKDSEGKYAFGSGHLHFAKTYDDAKMSPTAVIQALYNEPLDMLAFTDASYNYGAHPGCKEFSKEACENVGLYFEYNVVGEPWLVGSTNTDQQMHAKVSDGHFLIAQAPAAGGTFAERSETAIGKTPVVRVLLRDSRNNNAVVDVKYFRVEWVSKDVEDKKLGVVKTFDYTLDCDGFNTNNVFTWEDMSRMVLTQIGENGISRDDFVNLYKAPVIETEDKVHYWDKEVVCPLNNDRVVGSVGTAYRSVTDDDEVAGTQPVELVYNYGGVSPEDGVFTWYLTAHQIGSIMHEAEYTDHGIWVWPGTPVKRTVTITCESRNKHQRGDVTFQFEVLIKLPKEPFVSPMEGRSWKDGNNFDEIRFTPVILGTVNRGGATVVSGDSPVYDWDVQNSFKDVDAAANGGQIVGDPNKYDCFCWDIQFCHKQPNAYYVYANPDNTQRFAVDNSQKGYELLTKSNGRVAAKFDYDAAMGDRWYRADADATAKIHLTIDHTDEGVAMVENEHKMNVDVWSRINKYNYHLVKDFAVQVVKPLTINPETVDGFEDGYMGTQTLEIAEAVTMTDFMGWTVSYSGIRIPNNPNYTQADLFEYYKISSMKFDLANAYVDIAGRPSVDEYFGADALQLVTDNTTVSGCTLTNLTYDKKKSDLQTTTVYIVIDVTVKHYWGTAKATVRIPVNPGRAA